MNATFSATDLLGNPIVPPAEMHTLILRGTVKHGEQTVTATSDSAFATVREALRNGWRNLKWVF